MKNILLSMAVCAAVLSSCTRDEAAGNRNDAVTFTSGIASRASDATWMAGDRVGIYMTNNGGSLASALVPNRLHTASAGTSTTLTPDPGEEIYFPGQQLVDFVGYYPFTGSLAPDNHYPVNVAGQSNPEAIDLMWAKTAGRTKADGPVPMTFSHKLAKVAINLTIGADIDPANMVGAALSITGVPLTASFSLEDGMTFSNLGSTGVVEPKSLGSSGATYGFQALLIPQEGNEGRTLALRLADDRLLTWNIPATQDFVGGAQLNLNLQVTGMGIQLVSAGVGPWTEGTLPDGSVEPQADAGALTLDWVDADHAALIRGVEVTDAAGSVFTAPVNPATGEAGGLYALPANVAALSLYLNGRDRPLELAARYYTYNAGVLTITGGDGSAGLPRLVALPADLAAANTEAGGLALNYLQVRDIDFGGTATPWTPIGTDATPFTGVYDGGGYTIDRMAVSGGSYLGLFGFSSGTLRNIRLGARCSVTGTGSRIGGVCGTNDGAGARIENCTNAGTVYGTGSSYSVGGICGGNVSGATVIGCANTGAVEGAGYYIGGVCGYNYGATATVEDCTNAATVKATRENDTNSLGGVCGYSEQGTITGCANTGAVEGAGYYTGGVCGDNNQGTVENCTNAATVTATCADANNSLGGVCGWNNHGTVTGCANTGAVEGEGNNIGGVCGYNDGSTVEDCTNAATVKATSTGINSLGGVCGYNYRGTVTGCTNTGAVEGAGTNIGGVCGYNSGSTATVENCTNAATVKATSTSINSLGGVCGSNFSGTVAGCANTGAVEGAGSYIGGVCGSNFSGTVTGCANTGAVEGKGIFIGGVCGFNSGGTATVENCTNAATVKATRENDANYLGGVCGYNSNGTVTGCTNTGAVEGKGYQIGGVCGFNGGSTATVENCTNAATVTATSTGNNFLGGVCGYNSNGTVTGCANTGAVTGRGLYIGGVCGFIDGGTITACYTTGKVTGAGNVYHLAYIDSGTVKYCYWTAPAGDQASASSNDTSKETGCYQFGDGTGGTGWPAENAANGWGLWDGNAPRPAGCYWESLGGWNTGGATVVYPKLRKPL